MSLSLAEKQLEELASAIISQLQAGDLLLLQGALGVGKTALARCLICKLSGEEIIPSPSFALVQYYKTQQWHQSVPLLHGDFYRLAVPEESDMLDIFADKQAIIILEWAERGLIPSHYEAEDKLWQINIDDGVDDNKRDYHMILPNRMRVKDSA